MGFTYQCDLTDSGQLRIRNNVVTNRPPILPPERLLLPDRRLPAGLPGHYGPLERLRRRALQRDPRPRPGPPVRQRLDAAADGDQLRPPLPGLGRRNSAPTTRSRTTCTGSAALPRASASRIWKTWAPPSAHQPGQRRRQRQYAARRRTRPQLRNRLQVPERTPRSERHLLLPVGAQPDHPLQTGPAPGLPPAYRLARCAATCTARKRNSRPCSATTGSLRQRQLLFRPGQDGRAAGLWRLRGRPRRRCGCRPSTASSACAGPGARPTTACSPSSGPR